MRNFQNFAIIVAAGMGLRMGAKVKKQYLYLEGIPILSRTIMAFDTCDKVHEIVLVIPEQDNEYCKRYIIEPFGFAKKIHLVDGGKKRQDSVLNGLKHVQESKDSTKETIVLIHDGVRPFVNQDLIKACIQNAIEHGACIPGVKITDTIKQARLDSSIQKTLNRQFLYAAQTPQTFKFDLIWRAFDHSQKTCFSGTDDASILEHFGHKVIIIKGSKLNVKITTKQDLVLGKYLLKSI
jgi:2-C-methyl-D-erythritol 4-phosphate cytidylyltransferase